MINATELIGTMKNLDLHVRSYSGRNMFGKQCVGFTTDNEIYDCVQLALELRSGGVEPDDNLKLFRGATIDSMGRSTIVYFPRIEWPEDRQDDDDEE